MLNFSSEHSFKLCTSYEKNQGSFNYHIKLTFIIRAILWKLEVWNWRSNYPWCPCGNYMTVGLTNYIYHCLNFLLTRIIDSNGNLIPAIFALTFFNISFQFKMKALSTPPKLTQNHVQNLNEQIPWLCGRTFIADVEQTS